MIGYSIENFCKYFGGQYPELFLKYPELPLDHKDQENKLWKGIIEENGVEPDDINEINEEFNDEEGIVASVLDEILDEAGRTDLKSIIYDQMKESITKPMDTPIKGKLPNPQDIADDKAFASFVPEKNPKKPLYADKTRFMNNNKGQHGLQQFYHMASAGELLNKKDKSTPAVLWFGENGFFHYADAFARAGVNTVFVVHSSPEVLYFLKYYYDVEKLEVCKTFDELFNKIRDEFPFYDLYDKRSDLKKMQRNLLDLGSIKPEVDLAKTLLYTHGDDKTKQEVKDLKTKYSDMVGSEPDKDDLNSADEKYRMEILHRYIHNPEVYQKFVENFDKLKIRFIKIDPTEDKKKNIEAFGKVLGAEGYKIVGANFAMVDHKDRHLIETAVNNKGLGYAIDRKAPVLCTYRVNHRFPAYYQEKKHVAVDQDNYVEHRITCTLDQLKNITSQHSEEYTSKLKKISDMIDKRLNKAYDWLKKGLSVNVSPDQITCCQASIVITCSVGLFYNTKFFVENLGKLGFDVEWCKDNMIEHASNEVSLTISVQELERVMEGTNEINKATEKLVKLAKEAANSKYQSGDKQLYLEDPVDLDEGMKKKESVNGPLLFQQNDSNNSNSPPSTPPVVLSKMANTIVNAVREKHGNVAADELAEHISSEKLSDKDLLMTMLNTTSSNLAKKTSKNMF